MLTPASSYEDVYRGFRWQIPDPYNIGHDVCDRHAGDPTRRALIYEDAAGQIREYTFLEIMRRANRLANALAAQGLGRGDRIGILLPQSPETAIAHVATYKMGAIAVPLFTLFGADALEYRLAHSGARALITDRENLAKIETIRDRLPDLALIVGTDISKGRREGGLLAWAAALEAASDRFETAPTGPDDPALIIYTSGTTGPPKGALHAHRVLLGPSAGGRNAARVLSPARRSVLDAGRLGLDRRPDRRAAPGLAPRRAGARPSHAQVRARGGVSPHGPARRAQRLHAADRAQADAPGGRAPGAATAGCARWRAAARPWARGCSTGAARPSA